MEDLGIVGSLIGAIALNVLQLLVLLAGTGYSILKYSKVRKVSMIAVVAGLMGLLAVGVSIGTSIISQVMLANRSYELIPTIGMVSAILSGLLTTLMIIIFFVAIWTGRGESD